MACHAISSKTSCVSHPATLPNLFLDRSLGRVKVPRLLRAAGLHLVTLAEHYGMPHDQSVKDVDWLKMAGVNGYVVFMKDEAIRTNAHERAVVQQFLVRCFCVTRQGLSAAEMARRFIDNLDAITRACESPGPFIYAVQKARIDQRL